MSDTCITAIHTTRETKYIYFLIQSKSSSIQLITYVLLVQTRTKKIVYEFDNGVLAFYVHKYSKSWYISRNSLIDISKEIIHNRSKKVT